MQNENPIIESLSLVDMHNDEFEDKLWIERVKNSDEIAFEALFKKYYLPLSRFAWRYVKSKAEAEELIQDVFTDIWDNRTTLYLSGSLRPWLYKVVKNHCLNYLKHQKIVRNYDNEWVKQMENPKIEFTDELREQQIREAILRAVEELPPRCKVTFKLHRYDGLTYTEIADVLDVSEKTVEARMTKALRLLRTQLTYLLPVLAAIILI